MKKLALLLLCIALISGCKSSTKETKTVTVALMVDVFSRKAFDNAKARFEAAHPGVRVNMIEVTGSGYYQKLLTMFAGNSQPDLMWMGSGFGAFARKGLLANLDPFIAKENEDFLSSFHQKAVESYRLNGSLYGLPHGVDFQLLFFNKDMFDSAGLSYPSPDWTSDDVLSAARKMAVNKDGKTEVYGLIGRIHKISYGGRLVSDDGRRVLVNSPEMTAYIKYNYDMDKVYKVCPYSTVPEQSAGMGMTTEMAFAMGKSAMGAFGNYNLPAITKSARGINWGIAMVPNMGGDKRLIWASTSGFCISEKSKNKDLAWELMKCYLADEFMSEYYPNSMPARVDTLSKVLKADEKLPSEAYDVIMETLKYLYFEPRVESWAQISALYSESEVKVFLGKLSIQEALSEAAKKIEPLLDK